MHWCPVWSVVETTCTGSEIFFGLLPYRSILYIGSSFILCFSFVDIKASGMVLFSLFFSYVFRSISSIFFQLQRFFFHYLVP